VGQSNKEDLIAEINRPRGAIKEKMKKSKRLKPRYKLLYNKLKLFKMKILTCLRR
jgi:hypothetical protein